MCANDQLCLLNATFLFLEIIIFFIPSFTVWNVVISGCYLQVMSSLAEVMRGVLVQGLLAWQVRREWRSDLVRLDSVRLLVTLYSVISSAVSSTISISLHQVTTGLGWPPTTSHNIVTVSPRVWGPSLALTYSPSLVYSTGLSGGGRGHTV